MSSPYFPQVPNIPQVPQFVRTSRDRWRDALIAGKVQGMINNIEKSAAAAGVSTAELRTIFDQVGTPAGNMQSLVARKRLFAANPNLTENQKEKYYKFFDNVIQLEAISEAKPASVRRLVTDATLSQVQKKDIVVGITQRLTDNARVGSFSEHKKSTSYRDGFIGKMIEKLTPEFRETKPFVRSNSLREREEERKAAAVAENAIGGIR